MVFSEYCSGAVGTDGLRVILFSMTTPIVFDLLSDSPSIIKPE